MASFHKSLCIFFSFFFALLCFSNAYNFTVGGRNGWSLHPSESYRQWSGRMRFIIKDTLHFKYNGGSDSVIVVNNGDYDNCNTNNPITTLNGGDSFFKLNRSGPFYFISGNKSSCDQGQKLMVVVLSPRNKPSLPAAPAPATSSPVPTVSPVTSSPAFGTSISASPETSTDGGASSSPAVNPADVNAPAPIGSSAARSVVSASLSVSIAMIIFCWGAFY